MTRRKRSSLPKITIEGGSVAEHTYRSPILAAIHETAASLYSAGSMKKDTMSHFDEACLLTPLQNPTR